jgi:hypothetical protein
MVIRNRHWTPQVTLGAFIMICTIIGSGVGMYYRWNPPRAPSYSEEVWSLDPGFYVDVVWRKSEKPGGKDEFVYLIASPGGVPIAGSWRRSGHEIFIDGKSLITAHPDRKYWIYVAAPKADVRPVSGPEPTEPPADWRAFSTSRFWREQMAPELIEESKKYDRLWFEKYGTKNPYSRFTPSDTWDKWLAERADKRQR